MGSRCYSEDLTQGEVKIACKIDFRRRCHAYDKGQETLCVFTARCHNRSKKRKLHVSEDLPEPEDEKLVQFATIVLT